ncbi:MAG: type II toxin-antitoxin system HicA family toxin [Candidatus Omnitrophota bacterium]
MKVRDVIKILEADGWQLDRIRGSHRQFVHSIKKGTVTVVGKESIEMEIGLLRSVFRQAQIDWRKRK